MATPTAGWARVPSDTLSAADGDGRNPLVVIENAKARATNPTAIGSVTQALDQLTGGERADLGGPYT